MKNLSRLFMKTCFVCVVGVCLIAFSALAFAASDPFGGFDATPVRVDIESKNANPGDEIALSVTFSNVPDTGVTGAQLEIHYDKNLFSFIDLECGEIVNNPLFDISQNEKKFDKGVTVLYLDYDQTGTSHITKDGVFFVLKLKVSDNCPDGIYDFELHQTFSSVDGTELKQQNPFYTDVTWVELPVEMGKGTVTVGNASPGTISDKNVEIKLTIGDPFMSVNGVSMEVDEGRGTKPVIVNSRTLLPIRAVVESLGGVIGWEGTEKKVTINIDGSTIELWINNKTMLVNGIEIENDVAPIIINSRTFLPLRFVAENAGCEVGWEDATKTVTITK